MRELAPIALFIYNRPKHTLQTLEALANNILANESVLYVFADGPKPNATLADNKKIEETRQIVQSKKWCKEVFLEKRNNNVGLANNIISGVTELLQKFEAIIVLEDDLITATGFLSYMNKALHRYSNSDKIMQVSGYNFPTKRQSKNRSYFLPLTTSWGWGTWSRAWKKFDPLSTGYEMLKIDNKLKYRFDVNGTYSYSNMLFSQMEEKTIDSWAIRWWWTVFKEDGLTLYPDKSLVYNNGFGNDATHTQKSSFLVNDLCFNNEYQIHYFPNKILPNHKRLNNIRKHLAPKENLFVRLVRRIINRKLFGSAAFFNII